VWAYLPLPPPLAAQGVDIVSMFATIEILLQDKRAESRYVSVYLDTNYNRDEVRQEMNFVEFARLLIRASNRAKAKYERGFVSRMVAEFSKVYLGDSAFRMTDRQMSFICNIANQTPR
jgi:hypothetical protein